MTFPEMMFYAEAEGLLPTRLGCLNAVINDIKELPYSEIEFSEFKEILRNNGLNFENLSLKEINYINENI